MTFSWAEVDGVLSAFDAFSAVTRLEKKLRHIDIMTIDISDYNKRYFLSHLNKLKGDLQLYLKIIGISLVNKEKSGKDSLVLLDYGGGIGLISLLAIEMGIGNVFYSDIYDISCRDAEFLAKAIGNKANKYICGDIINIIDYFKKNNIKCNAIVSSDVIEHIYDIESFFKYLCKFPGDNLSISMATGANPFNPLIKRSLMRQHAEIENKDREKKWGHKERDTLQSYYQVRKEIILEYLINKKMKLNDRTVGELASRTRGLMKNDILNQMDIYFKDGKLSYQPDPTNTCDPYTGNWAEHLMDPYELRNVVRANGYQAYVIPGKYEIPVIWESSGKKTIKNILKYIMNALINIFYNDMVKLKFAPNYIIAGYKGLIGLDE